MWRKTFKKVILNLILIKIIALARYYKIHTNLQISLHSNQTKEPIKPQNTCCHTVLMPRQERVNQLNQSRELYLQVLYNLAVWANRQQSRKQLSTVPTPPLLATFQRQPPTPTSKNSLSNYFQAFRKPLIQTGYKWVRSRKFLHILIFRAWLNMTNDCQEIYSICGNYRILYSYFLYSRLIVFPIEL